MANEILMQTKLYAKKGGAQISAHTSEATVTMAGTHMAEWTQTIGTSAEAIAVPSDITSGSSKFRLEIKSLEADGGNYVELALDNSITQIFCELSANTPCLNTIKGGVTVYGKANTAAVVVSCRAVQV